MGQVRADHRLDLVGAPSFLSLIGPREASWRPLAALALMIPLGGGLMLLGFLVSGLLNGWIIQVAVLGERPTWPSNVLAAAASGRVVCQGCLMGGITDTVMIAVIMAGCMTALLVSVAGVYRRPALTFVTAAPRFRWRLFWIGLAFFGLVLGAVATAPEAAHGWPDRPVFLKADEQVRVQIAYIVVMLVGLPLAASFEEVLCRGWLLQVTAAFTRSLPAILIANSLVFAMLHIDGDAGRNISRVVLGMALSWGVLRTGGLELGIGIHAANNLVILVLAQTLQQTETVSHSSAFSVAVNLLVSLIALGVIELVARWGPLRRWSGLALAEDEPQAPEISRANSTLAAP
jgi:membrane protease YdiL (CAAX protease family)